MITEILATIEGTHSSGSNFNCGIVLWNDRVVEAAPIVRFMKRWTRDQVRDHCKRQGWTINVVHQVQRS